MRLETAYLSPKVLPMIAINMFNKWIICVKTAIRNKMYKAHPIVFFPMKNRPVLNDPKVISNMNLKEPKMEPYWSAAISLAFNSSKSS